ncbi:type II secretion system F family protein [Aneurinibacillus thermoaerophilus]|uniref:type II secretion system F family protein n=1 Tax=Aneurinibacillus thermoaerophilus TaxID=143495 RepID=UPI002E22D33B|nr:type II secretion system F family protein [Aneurinibacillus thermoaerophilus]
MSQTTIYFLLLLVVMIALLYLGIVYSLPKKRFRSWAMGEKEAIENKVIKEMEARRSSKFEFLKFCIPSFYEAKAAKIEWDIEGKGPLILYGSMLTGIAIGLFMESYLTTIVAVVAGFWAPWFLLQMKTYRYEEKISEQVEVLIQGVAAGYAITRNLDDSLKRAIDGLEEPLRSKWELFVVERTSGQPLDDLLDRLTEELPVKEFAMFASVLKTVDKNGGDASDTMKQVAAVILSNRMLNEELKAELADMRQAHRFNIAIGIAILLFFRFAQAEKYSVLMSSIIGQVLVTGMFLYILWSFKAVAKLTRI